MPGKAQTLIVFFFCYSFHFIYYFIRTPKADLGGLHLLSGGGIRLGIIVLRELSRSGIDGTSYRWRSRQWWLVLERASRKLSTTRCFVLSGMWCLDPRLWSLVCILLRTSTSTMSLCDIYYVTDCDLTRLELTETTTTFSLSLLDILIFVFTDVLGPALVLVGGIWWRLNYSWSAWMFYVTLVSFLWL